MRRAAAIRRAVAFACCGGGLALALVAIATAGLRHQKVYEVGDTALDATFVKLPGDARTDLVVSNRGDDDISILRGRRSGRLRAPVDVSAGLEPMAVVPGDFNGDGRVDLAVANQTVAGGVAVLLSAPGGGFVLPPQTFPGPSQATYMVAGRFTNDSKLDLAVTGFADNEIAVLQGDGAGGFDPLPSITKPGAFPIGTGDFDRDGEADLVGGGDDNEIDFYAGMGNGQFEAGVPTHAGQSPNGLDVGRINADRNLDVAVANYGGVGSVTALLGRGDGTFKRRQINFTEENSPADIAILRFNRDRHADLAFTDSFESKLIILRGKGRGRFRAPLTLDAGADAYGMDAAKLHGDRLTDLAVANSEDATVSVYLGR